MRNKMLIAATYFAFTANGAFAQDLLLANAGFSQPVSSSETTGNVGAAAVTSPAAALNATTAKTREQVRAELAEYNRQNPRGYLYTYYLGDILGRQ